MVVTPSAEVWPFEPALHADSASVPTTPAAERASNRRFIPSTAFAGAGPVLAGPESESEVVLTALGATVTSFESGARSWPRGCRSRPPALSRAVMHEDA